MNELINVEAYICNCVLPATAEEVSLEQYRRLLTAVRMYQKDTHASLFQIMDGLATMQSRLSAALTFESCLVKELGLEDRAGNPHDLILEEVQALLTRVRNEEEALSSLDTTQDDLEEFFDSEQEGVDDECK